MGSLGSLDSYGCLTHHPVLEGDSVPPKTPSEYCLADLMGAHLPSFPTPESADHALITLKTFSARDPPITIYRLENSTY